MKNLQRAKYILTFVGVYTLIMPWVFDLQKTHIYNPNWPPHAKFHDGQTLMLSLALGLAILYYAWRKKGIAADNFAIALLAAGVYYVTQFLALLVPNTALLDPEFLATTPQPLGLAPQVWVAGVALLILVGAWLLGRGEAAAQQSMR